MYVCMYVSYALYDTFCIHVCIKNIDYTHIFMYIYTYTYIYTCMDEYVHVYLYIYTYKKYAYTITKASLER